MEAAYNVFSAFTSISSELSPFIRYENYNIQMKMSGGLTTNDACKILEIVVGLGWNPINGAVVEADSQFVKPGNSDAYLNQLNIGVGVWF